MTKAMTNGASATSDAPTIELQRLERSELSIPIIGTTPLITHRWSEKALKEMADSQQGKTKVKKPPKDPEAEFNAARYRIDDRRDGLPAAAFKSAIVDAARYFDSITMVMLKQMLRVEGIGSGQLVEIVADAPTMREDAVRLPSGTSDLRYRPQYDPWGATIVVRYLPSQISPESIVALVDAAGIGGVGEWRPTAPKGKSGSFGTFEVVT